MKLREKVKNQLNEKLAPYNGFLRQDEIDKIWRLLENYDIELLDPIIIDCGYMSRNRAEFTFEGEIIENSYFICNIYKDPKIEKKEYTVYFT